MRPAYQLTAFPVGSLREIFTVSWPLILAILSNSLMMFADRLFLANYSLEAMNASATGGMAAFLLLIFPLVIAGMSEVFVGRLNGENQQEKIGQAVWQMIWFSIATGPYFWILSRALTPFLFYGSPLIEWERDYFVISSDFGPFWCLTCALNGFYIGTGRSWIVMVVTVLSNVINIALDYVFVFGMGPIPEMGVKGAAIATGLSSFVTVALLGYGFLRSKNAVRYKSRDFLLIPKLFIDGIRVGLPAGVGRFTEVCAHLAFLRVVAYSGGENLTIVAIVQSIYLLIAFCTEGLCKAVTAVTANLIGAGEYSLINKVLKAASFQHLTIFAVLAIALYFFSSEIIAIFVSEAEATILQNPEFMHQTFVAMAWMCVFFLFDGLCWIFIGLLLAAQDTKFLLYASLALNWVFYVIPSAVGLLYLGWGAQEAWMILGCSGGVNFAIMITRYVSGKWRLRSNAAAFTRVH